MTLPARFDCNFQNVGLLAGGSDRLSLVFRSVKRVSGCALLNVTTAFQASRDRPHRMRYNMYVCVSTTIVVFDQNEHKYAFLLLLGRSTNGSGNGNHNKKLC